MVIFRYHDGARPNLLALISYVLAYFILEHVLRFMDALKHTYEVWIRAATLSVPMVLIFLPPFRSRR